MATHPSGRVEQTEMDKISMLFFVKNPACIQLEVLLLYVYVLKFVSLQHTYDSTTKKYFDNTNVYRLKFPTFPGGNECSVK